MLIVPFIREWQTLRSHHRIGYAVQLNFTLDYGGIINKVGLDSIRTRAIEKDVIRLDIYTSRRKLRGYEIK